MSDRIRLDGTTVDAPDALALARFYATLTGGVARGTREWAAPAGILSVLVGRLLEDPYWVPRSQHTDDIYRKDK